MFSCKNILAVIDPNSDTQTSLIRALHIAKETGAKIVALTCIYDKSFDMTAVLTSDERYNMKEAMMSHAKEQQSALLANIDNKETIELVVTWQKKLHESVIDTAKEYQCDLIVKATKHHGALASTLFTPNDWHILRKSPVDVLLVKSHKWPIKASIVASIGVSAKDDAHVCLSDKVAQTAHGLSKLLGGDVHFANSFAGAPVHIAVEVPNFSPEVYNKSVQERHLDKLAKLGTQYKMETANIHVLEGLPEDVIPGVCKTQKADLLVIGSVGRKGLSAALLGNTAELIIDSVDCDTLVVKPA